MVLLPRLATVAELDSHRVQLVSVVQAVKEKYIQLDVIAALPRLLWARKQGFSIIKVIFSLQPMMEMKNEIVLD